MLAKNKTPEETELEQQKDDPARQAELDAAKAMADKAFNAAIAQAAGSRKALISALAATFRLYLVTREQPTYLTELFDAKEIAYQKTTEMFPSIVRLVFGLSDPKYNSRVSTYAMALKHIKKQFKEPASMPEQGYDASEYHVSEFENILDQAGGITAAAELARDKKKNENETPEEKEKIAEFIRNSCDSFYQAKADSVVAELATHQSKGEYVLVMGRVGDKGTVELLETLDLDKERILNLAKDTALKDTSRVDPVINTLAQCFGFLDVYTDTYEPIVCIDKNGSQIQISGPKEKQASIIVSVKPKSKTPFTSLKQKLNLSHADKKWLRNQIVPTDRRQMFKLQDEPNPESKAPFSFKIHNAATDGNRYIHLNSILKMDYKPVELDTAIMTNWSVTGSIKMSDLQNLYDNWLAAWQIKKEAEGKDFKGKFLELSVTENQIELKAKGFKPFTLSCTNNLKDAFVNFDLRCAEFKLIVEQLVAMDGVDHVKFSGIDNRLLEMSAEDSNAEYTVDIPNLNTQRSGYDTKYFL